MGVWEGWRRQGKRMGQGGGDPSLQQGQEILLVLHAEVGRQVLTARGSHCSSHQQLPGSLLVQLGPVAQPCQPTGSAVCRRHPQVGHGLGGSCLCSPNPFPFPPLCWWPLAAGGRLAQNSFQGQLEGARAVTQQPNWGFLFQTWNYCQENITLCSLRSSKLGEGCQICPL